MSILDTAAILYVWDQFFLSGWDPQTIEDISVVLLLLLRHWFMQAQDYTELKEVGQYPYYLLKRRLISLLVPFTTRSKIVTTSIL